MPRMKTLLLIPALALVLAACGGAGDPQWPSGSPGGSTPSADTTAPATPNGLTATSGGSSSINLSWSPTTDDVGVTGYIVRRNGIQVGTPVTTSYVNTGLAAGTTYSYTVAARDAAGNTSLFSTSASATTAGTPPPGGIPSTLGWFEIPNTQLVNVCAADHGFPEVAGNTGCASIYIAWSGAVFDPTRNRLVIWGGGHGDYAGNEVYALDLNALTLLRLNDPSTPVRDGCTNGGTNADGKPVARHTYNHLAYLPNQDAMFAWGGSQSQCGNFGADAWLLNFSNLSWTKKSGVNGPGGGFGLAAAYDPNTGLVYMHDSVDLRSYNPSTNAWSKRSSASVSGGLTAGVVDPVRKKYFTSVSGATALYSYDISSSTAVVAPQSAATTGCAGFLGSERVGMEYDPVQDRIVGWNGGNTVYILNPDTLSCTTVSHTGGPTAPGQGTYGRFRYSPSLNVFVVCNNVNENCHTLRLTP